MKGHVITGKGTSSLKEIQEPQIPKDGSWIKVKVEAVALNPTDWKHRDFVGKENNLTGCDGAGIVDSIGDNAKVAQARGLLTGDRIAFMVNGSNALENDRGAFGEYAIVKDGIFFRLPASMNAESGSTLALGLYTAGQQLYRALGLPLPSQAKTSSDQYVLVYGGSTATGTIVIQLAKASGYRVVTTCSKKNFQLVKSLGAEEAFDYSDSNVGAKIREYTKDSLTLVSDCIAEKGSGKICGDALSSKSSNLKYASLLPHNTGRENVESIVTLAYNAIGEQYKWLDDSIKSPSADEYEWATLFSKEVEPLLADGRVKPHPVKLNKGGLAGISEGFEELKSGKVSGAKLVYRISETSK